MQMLYMIATAICEIISPCSKWKILDAPGKLPRSNPTRRKLVSASQGPKPTSHTHDTPVHPRSLRILHVCMYIKYLYIYIIHINYVLKYT